MRNTLGGVAPLFASQFFYNLGIQYAGLILAISGTVLTFIPFVMFKYGHVSRARSKLVQTQKGSDEQKDRTGLYTAPFVCCSLSEKLNRPDLLPILSLSWFRLKQYRKKEESLFKMTGINPCQ